MFKNNVIIILLSVFLLPILLIVLADIDLDNKENKNKSTIENLNISSKKMNLEILNSQMTMNDNDNSENDFDDAILSFFLGFNINQSLPFYIFSITYHNSYLNEKFYPPDFPGCQSTTSNGYLKS